MKIKKIFILFLIIFLQGFITACIDINTASLEELDQLDGIGPVKAQAIVDSRPFSSVDDLIRVDGIGEITLSNIKNQGLACVDGEEEPEPEEQGETEENETDIINISQSQTGNTILASQQQSEPQKANETSEVIELNPKNINSEDDNSKIIKSNYALYGLIIFLIFIILLLLLKRKKYQNEFG